MIAVAIVGLSSAMYRWAIADDGDGDFHPELAGSFAILASLGVAAYLSLLAYLFHRLAQIKAAEANRCNSPGSRRGG